MLLGECSTRGNFEGYPTQKKRTNDGIYHDIEAQESYIVLKRNKRKENQQKRSNRSEFYHLKFRTWLLLV